MVKAFEIAGYSKDVIEEKFSALFNAFQYGAPPHAGIAPGVDSSSMNLAIDPWNVPSSRSLIHASPFAPHS